MVFPRPTNVSAPPKIRRGNAPAAPTKRSRMQRSSVVTVPRGLGTFAPKRQTVLKYADHVSITTDAAGFGLHTFLCNDLFKPDFTGAGHQPLGFDQLMDVYTRYQVSSSTIRAQLVDNSDSADTFSLVILMNRHPTLGASWNIRRILEQPDMYSTLIHPSTGVYSPVSNSWKFQYFEISPNVGAEGSATASATDLWYYHVILQSHAHAVGTFEMQIEMKMNALFDRTAGLDQS